MQVLFTAIVLFCSLLIMPAQSQIVSLEPLPDGSVRIVGGNTDLNLGTNAVTIGDINGDGRDDYALAAPQADLVYIIYGRQRFPQNINLNMLGANGFIILGDVGTDFGASLAAVGDVNRDSRADLAIGAPGAGEGGKVYVLRGDYLFADITTQDLDRFLFVIEGVSSEIIGMSLQQGGDINNDGFSDVFITSPNREITIDDTTTIGAVYVIYGSLAYNPNEFKTDALPVNSLVLAANPNSLATDYGLIFKRVHDFTGDGHADCALLLGLDFNDSLVTSEIAIFSGITKPTGTYFINNTPFPKQIYSVRLFNNDEQNMVSSIESTDSNGDGIPELILGFPKANAFNDPENYGAVAIIPGSVMALGSGLIDRTRPVTIIGTEQENIALGLVMDAHENLLALGARTAYNPYDLNSQTGLVYVIDIETIDSNIILVEEGADRIFLGSSHEALFGFSLDFTIVSSTPYLFISQLNHTGLDLTNPMDVNSLGISAFLVPALAEVTVIDDFSIY